MSTKFTRPTKPAEPVPEQGQGLPYKVPHMAEDVDSSDEERTHFSVFSRRLKKRRKTNSSLVSNPFGSFPSPDHSTDSPFGKFENSGDDDDEDSERTSRRRKSACVPESDKAARQRCYDYLHTAIDAVWAEYCDSTSYAESLKYMPHSPVSEHEDSVFLSSGEEENTIASFAKAIRPQRAQSISMQPQSQCLMRQKKRLLDAKYLLSHFVGAPDTHSSATFWKVWDQLKYSTVELVEGDDEEAEEVIDDLEAGRCCYSEN